MDLKIVKISDLKPHPSNPNQADVKKKICIQCKKEKLITEFHIRASRCKACIKIKSAEYRRVNVDKIRKSKIKSYKKHLAENKEKGRLYYLANKETKKAYQKEYREFDKERNKKQKALHYQRHREDIKRKTTKWRLANLEKMKKWNQKYRQTPKGRAVITHSRAKRRAALLGCKATDCVSIITQWRKGIVQCYLCGAFLNGNDCHIDHIIPLASGGKHEPSNIAPSCPFCNLSKGSKSLEEYRQGKAIKAGRINAA